MKYLICVPNYQDKDEWRQSEHIKMKNDDPKQDHVHKRSEQSSELKRNHKARMYMRKTSTEKGGTHQLMCFNRKWKQDIWKRAEVAPQSATRRFTFDSFWVCCLNATHHQNEITNQDLTKKGSDPDQLIDIVKPENRHRHSRGFPTYYKATEKFTLVGKLIRNIKDKVA